MSETKPTTPIFQAENSLIYGNRIQALLNNKGKDPKEVQLIESENNDPEVNDLELLFENGEVWEIEYDTATEHEEDSNYEVVSQIFVTNGAIRLNVSALGFSDELIEQINTVCDNDLENKIEGSSRYDHSDRV